MYVHRGGFRGRGPGGPDSLFVPNMYEITIYPEIKL